MVLAFIKRLFLEIVVVETLQHENSEIFKNLDMKKFNRWYHRAQWYSSLYPFLDLFYEN